MSYDTVFRSSLDSADREDLIKSWNFSCGMKLFAMQCQRHGGKI